MTVLHICKALAFYLFSYLGFDYNEHYSLSIFRFSCSCWHPSWNCSWSVQLTRRSWFSRSWVWRHRIVTIQILGTEGTSTGDCSPLTLLQQRCDNQTSQLRTFCLRNRKHVPCFCRVIQTRVEVWENEKCCGNTSRSFFEFSQTFTSVCITR